MMTHASYHEQKESVGPATDHVYICRPGDKIVCVQYVYGCLHTCVHVYICRPGDKIMCRSGAVLNPAIVIGDSTRAPLVSPCHRSEHSALERYG
jgi:hypothetical protein